MASRRATAVQVVLVLEDAEILEGIALHYEEVRVLSWFHGADPILHAEDLRVDAGGGEQHLHGLHDLGLQLELDGALGLHVAEEIGARADLAAGPVGLGQPLHGELACRVDLLELMLAHPVGLALAPDGLVGDHGRHQIGAGLPDLARPRLVEQVAVLDAAHPRLQRGADGRTRVGVREDVLPHGARLFHRGAHLVHRVLRGVELVGGGHGAPRGHDLDLVHVVAELLARRLAHLVGPIGDHPDHTQAAVDGLDPLGAPTLVAVAARLGEGTPGDEQARSRVETACHRLSEAIVGSPRIPHGSEALLEGLLDAPERLGRDEAGRMVAMLLRGVALHRAHVHVGVGEAGHERAPLEIERLHVAAERADLARGDHVLDALALQHHRGAFDGLRARAVDEEGVGQDREGDGRLLSAWRSWLRTSTPSRRRAATSRSSSPPRRDRAVATGRPRAPR